MLIVVVMSSIFLSQQLMDQPLDQRRRAQIAVAVQAVDVPHAVALRTVGRWSSSAGRSAAARRSTRASPKAGCRLCSALPSSSVERKVTGPVSSDSSSVAPTTNWLPGAAPHRAGSADASGAPGAASFTPGHSTVSTSPRTPRSCGQLSLAPTPRASTATSTP
jgi:hypothetical protein